MTKQSLKKYFDIICIIELFTCFLLFCIAMPLKYGFDILEPMRPIGMLHGVAFIAYIAFAFVVKNIYEWKTKEFILILLYGFIPFATWLTHKKVESYEARQPKAYEEVK